VIGTSGSDLSRIVIIDKGKSAGIDRDMAVITSEGIVGKVLLVSPNLAQVLLISDQSSGVGAILEKSRLQGVLRGTPNGEVVLERVMSDEQVQPGETVLTSGGDQIFPKGLPVGTVTKVGSGKDLFLSIKIKPAANLSKLEEVLVLTEKQERQVVADDHVRVRAADILAQRLPSVPDKPAAEAVPPGVAQGTSQGPAANTTAKPAGTNAANAAGAVKSASGNTPAKSTTVPVQPGKTAAQTSATQKPKPVNNPPTESKPEASQALPPTQPSIVEQKPAPVAAQPDSPQPPPQDNSPQ
jgi:rod shape-determining protein MreC